MQINKIEGHLFNFKSSSVSVKTKRLQKAFTDKTKAFPTDLAYFRKLGQGLNLSDANLFKIVSIIGPEELNNLLVNAKRDVFCVGEEFANPILSNNDYENLAKRGFSFNLHIHTNHSDGKMSVLDLLNQSAEYADILKRMNPASRFVIAITDHDSLEGGKEALKIISENPKKYENLGIVLGAELSAVYNNSEIFNVPLVCEMIAYSINPYQKDLNDDLSVLRNNRINLSKEIIESAKNLYPEYDFSYEELCTTSNNPKKGIDGFLYSIANYLKLKSNNREGIEKLSLSLLPDMENSTIVNTVENILLKMKEGYGFLGIAHPGKIYLGDGKIRKDFINKCKSEKKDTGIVIINRFLNYLKNIGGDKFKAMETYYQSYSGVLKSAQDVILGSKELDKSCKDSVKWLNIFNKFVDENGLLNTGGLDSHSENPFKKR